MKQEIANGLPPNPFDRESHCVIGRSIDSSLYVKAKSYEGGPFVKRDTTWGQLFEGCLMLLVVLIKVFTIAVIDYAGLPDEELTNIVSLFCAGALLFQFISVTANLTFYWKLTKKAARGRLLLFLWNLLMTGILAWLIMI